MADLRFLTSDEPERVSSAYEAALSPVLGSGARRSISEQLEMHRDLGILVENATPALALLAGPPDPREALVRPLHPLVFSGHMIDAPNRQHPRFPASQEDVAAARIRQAIEEIAAAAAEGQERIVGLAGVPDGGDLLFHEACHQLGVETLVLLPVPELVYRATAMTRQASRWADRYHAALRNASAVLTLAHTDTLPGWLQARPDYSTWQRDNQWILRHAWATATICNGSRCSRYGTARPGDGPGGAADRSPPLRPAEPKSSASIRWRCSACPPRSWPPGNCPPLELPALGLPTLNLPTPAADAASGPGAERAPAGADIGARPSAITAPGDGAGPAVGDRVLNLLWRSHRQWSLAADAAQSRLNRWRQRTLALLVAGALAGALAAQTWLSSGFVSAAAAVSAVLLALAAWVQGTALTSDRPSAGRRPGRLRGAESRGLPLPDQGPAL